MRTKNEYYEQVLKNRKLVSDPEITKCTCQNTLCDWHGKCKECVALHRFHNNHVPVCLQPIIEDKLKELVGVVEMIATKKEATPIEYRHYVKECDINKKGKKQP
ncbi:MAG: hypothetical protein FWF92_10250 [Oscillospiraceae bacterium]|nr:hypothetical protein [Oscillospiraceae bacterium]